MDLTRCLLLGVLVLGLLHAGLAKPSAKPTTPSEDYELNDDSYDYDDDAASRSAEKEAEKAAAAAGAANNIDANNVLAAPFFAQTEYTATVREGDTAMLECRPSNLGPESVLMWYNGSQLLYQSTNRVSNDQRISLKSTADEFTLRIADVQVADQGDYRCRVLPSNSEVTARLVVQTRPQVHIYGKDGRDISEQQVQLHQGERFEMECRGSGRPRPHKIFWSADGQRLQSHAGGPNGGVTVADGQLVILSAGHEHVRKYQCLADNGVTVGHAGVTITVRYTPRVSTHRHVNTMLGNNAELHCNYYSAVDTQIEWQKNDRTLALNDPAKYKLIKDDDEEQSLDDHHKTRLQVRNVQVGDLGDYRCVVRNSIGNGHATTSLQLEPEQPHLEHTDVAAGNPAQVVTHWTIRSHQALNEVALSYKLNGTTSWQSEIPIKHEKSKEHSGLWKIQHQLELVPGVWHARVRARNSAGWSLFSEETTINVMQMIDDSESGQYFDEEIRSNGALRSAERSSLLAAFVAVALFASAVRRF